jgi:hypothetical protein
MDEGEKKKLFETVAQHRTTSGYGLLLLPGLWNTVSGQVVVKRCGAAALYASSPPPPQHRTIRAAAAMKPQLQQYEAPRQMITQRERRHPSRERPRLETFRPNAAGRSHRFIYGRCNAAR